MFIIKFYLYYACRNDKEGYICIYFYADMITNSFDTISTTSIVLAEVARSIDLENDVTLVILACRPLSQLLNRRASHQHNDYNIFIRNKKYFKEFINIRLYILRDLYTGFYIFKHNDGAFVRV